MNANNNDARLAAAMNDGRLGAACERCEAAADDWDEVSWIMAYEGGELDEDDIIAGFQHLVDNGHAWILQGHYGRTAARLIDAGLVTPAEVRP